MSRNIGIVESEDKSSEEKTVSVRIVLNWPSHVPYQTRREFVDRLKTVYGAGQSGNSIVWYAKVSPVEERRLRREIRAVTEGKGVAELYVAPLSIWIRDGALEVPA